MADKENSMLSRAGIRGDIEISLGFPPPPALDGGIVRARIVELGGVSPGSIIRSDQDWKVEVDWYLWGWLLCLPGISFDWEWVVYVYLESMGPGKEYKLPQNGYRVRFDAGKEICRPPACPTCYWKWTTDNPELKITAGTVLPGTYKAVVSLSCQVVPSGEPVPIAGSHEIRDMVQIYRV